MVGLWGEEFDDDISLEDNTKSILKKTKTPKEVKVTVKQQLNSKKLSLEDKLELIRTNTLQVLGRHVSTTLVIKTKEQFVEYMDKSISNGILAFDTETNNSLDPITCKVMGLCLYTPGMLAAYVPINHTNLLGERLSWQLNEQDCYEQLKRCVDNKVKFIMHNGKFDYQVIKCTCNICLPIYWDTMIASYLLDENEPSHGLKQQYIDKIDHEQEKYNIEGLFTNVEYAYVEPEIFALYSAHDAIMTYQLYDYQRPIFESKDYEKINHLFHEIEMPCVEVVAEMELSGVEIDQEYGKRLSVKYHKMLDDIDLKINNELLKVKSQIDAWRLTKEANTKIVKNGKEGKSPNEQLEEPINLGSPTQLSILLYDVLKVGVIDKKSPRGTGEEILEKIDLPICKLLLERRGILKLISGYIDTIPDIASKNIDGRIRTHFNQYGAATGRFSSSDPVNFQNIPSHNKEIRMLFKARDGYTFVGSDFSQQEIRCLANYAQDPIMVQAYKDKKDFYATTASGVYHNTYWDNMEHWEDGTPNPEGKKRRSSCKSIVLGLMYGRGAKAIAEQIGGTVEEAQKIIDDFYTSYPLVRQWMDKTVSDAKKNGYVEDLWGRRRRLPDIQLDKFEIKLVSNGNELANFNPFMECDDKQIDPKIFSRYNKLLNKARGKKEVDKIKEDALKEGIEIHDNSGFISQAERQCVNARIQGGSATMTKIAMNKIYRDKELNDLDFKLLIGVHDELIGECPKENSDKVASRLTYIMRTCIEDVCNVPFSCDADISDHWYFNDYSDNLNKEYRGYLDTMSQEEAMSKLIENHSELLEEEIKNIILG